MSKYSEILNRLKEATGTDCGFPDNQHFATAATRAFLGREPARPKDPEYWELHSLFARAGWLLDAAISLVEKTLPGWYWATAKHEGCYHALLTSGIYAESSLLVSAPTAPLAVLRALFTALEAREAEHG